MIIIADCDILCGYKIFTAQKRIKFKWHLLNAYRALIYYDFFALLLIKENEIRMFVAIILFYLHPTVSIVHAWKHSWAAKMVRTLMKLSSQAESEVFAVEICLQ